MRIVHLIYDDLGNPWLSGGGAVRAREIYRRLAERHEVTLVCGRYPGAPVEEEVDGVRIVRVGSEAGYARSRLAYCQAALGQLARHDWDVWVHEFSAFAPLWPSRSLRRRGVLFFYHFVGAHALVKHPLVGGVSWAAESLTLRGYERILTISPSVTEQVRRRRPDAEVTCVFTGVDRRYFDLRPDEADYILYFGRTDIHTKGLDTLVTAFARVAVDHPHVRLVFAGRGAPPEQARLERLIADAHLGDRVEVFGGVDETTKGELLRQARFVCMPSRYEGWGIVAVEAAAAGRPVLGTRIPGLVDAVCDGETGLLVTAGDAAALAGAMQRLLADPELRRRQGEAGREWARRFDWERIATEQEALLLQAAAANGTARD